MEEVKHEDIYVVCYQPNGVIIHVPKDVFADVVLEMKKRENEEKSNQCEKPSKRDETNEVPRYVTYKEGAKMYRMSEKSFREWSNRIGAAKHISQTKVIVSVQELDDFLKYA